VAPAGHGLVHVAGRLRSKCLLRTFRLGSRDLNPQVVGITDSGKVVTSVIPLKGASLSAYLRAMNVLLVTEGDRRRLQVELERPEARDANEERAQATVTNIRQRLGADPKPS
jgi:hypothetical protein